MQSRPKRTINSDPATIKEIAKKAKVSIGTVDRVVHSRGRVAPATERRVKKVIAATGYKPNIYASHLSRAKSYHFGAVIPRPEQDSAFWETLVEGVELAVRELHHYRVRVKYFHYDHYDPEQFKQVERQVLKTPLDGILFAPVLRQPIHNLISKLPAGLPYVFINSDVEDLAPLSFIGQDSKQSGLVCGRLLRLLAPPRSSVAAILTVPDDPHIRSRIDGFRDAFPSNEKVKVWEYELFTPDKKEVVAAVLRSILSSHPDLSGLFVPNVAVHYLAEQLQRFVPDRKVFLIGYDLIEANIEYLRSGVIDFLISQKPERQSYEGLYALYRAVALREKPLKKILMPIDIITKENVSFYETS
jgi:LacI family transcriptional regulator